MEQFVQTEIKDLKEVHYPNICQLHEVNVQSQFIYSAMHLCPDGSVSSLFSV